MEYYLRSVSGEKLTGMLRDYSTAMDSGGLRELARCSNESDNPIEERLSLLLMQMLADEDAELYSALGDRYYSGDGVVKDTEKALFMFRKAAERGSARAMYDLAWYYNDRRELMQAIEYFEKCISLQDKLSSYMVGKSYAQLGAAYANLPAPQYQKAIENLTVAADKYKDSFAARRLGMIYREQAGGNFSPDKCLHYLEQACSAGDEIAAELLADYYIWGDQELNVSRDFRAAERVLTPFAESEFPLLLRYLGFIYLNGDVKSGFEADFAKARGYFERSLQLEPNDRVRADLGYACFRLDDYSKAHELLIQADKGGVYIYSDFLGRMYAKGVGIPKNEQLALEYYGKCYHAGCINNLFTCYEYAELLYRMGDSRRAFEVAQYGHDKYHDTCFLALEAELVLTGKIKEKMSMEQAAELLQICISHDSYVEKCHMLLGQYEQNRGNYRLAENHFMQAVSAGSADAAVWLGKLYEHGAGTIKANANQAYEWYSKAASMGSQWGKQELSGWRKGLLGGWRRG